VFCCEMKLGAPETAFKEALETAMWKLETRGVARASSADPWPPVWPLPLAGKCWGEPPSTLMKAAQRPALDEQARE
jgi:hypothetical protein